MFRSIEVMPPATDRSTRLSMRLVKSPLARRAMRLANAIGSPFAPFRARVGPWTLHAPTVDRLAALLVARRTFDRDPGIRLWRRLCRAGTCAIDVGANMGLYSLVAAEAVGPTGRVISVEADHRNADAAERSVRLADARHVRLLRIAALDRDGEVELGTRDDHAGDHQVMPDDPARRTSMVPCRRLDSVVDRDLEVSAIKLDIQGAEGLAVAGLEATIAANPRVAVLMEFWPSALRRCGTDAAALLGWWRARGFSAAFVDEDSLREVDLHHADEVVAVADSRSFCDLVLARDPAAWRDGTARR